MDDTEFERFLTQKYAQVVLKVLLDAEGQGYAFGDLRDEVNTIVADDSRGAEELTKQGEYSPASLSSLLSDAEDADIVEKRLNQDGEIRWALRSSQLSQSQTAKIRSKNKSSTNHIDTAKLDFYPDDHTDSNFS